MLSSFSFSSDLKTSLERCNQNPILVHVKIGSTTRNSFIDGSLKTRFIDRSTFSAPYPNPFIYVKDSLINKEPFIVAGVNKTSDIRNLKTITGVDIDVLNERMRGTGDPNTGASIRVRPSYEEISNPLMRVSGPGFLNPSQNLITILTQDNDYVLSRNLTHQDIGKRLIKFLEKVESSRTTSIKVGEYEISTKDMGGRSFFVTGPDDQRLKKTSGWIGFGTQGSPFNDEIFTNYNLEIKNLSTNEVFEIDALTPYLIYRYGFYQGGIFRKSPESILSFFGQAFFNT